MIRDIPTVDESNMTKWFTSIAKVNPESLKPDDQKCNICFHEHATDPHPETSLASNSAPQPECGHSLACNCSTCALMINTIEAARRSVSGVEIQLPFGHHVEDDVSMLGLLLRRRVV